MNAKITRGIMAIFLTIFCLNMAQGAEKKGEKRMQKANVKMSEDCSKGPIPDQALELSVGSEKLPVPPISSLRKTSEITGEKVYDQYALSVQDKDMFATTEVRFTVLVPKGQRPDGKTFRKLPTLETKAQPAAESGLPEVQSWAVKIEARELDISSVGFVGSLRVEFGQRRGDLLPGKVYLCIPGGQTDKLFGTKLADPVTLIGSFEAKIL